MPKGPLMEQDLGAVAIWTSSGTAGFKRSPGALGGLVIGGHTPWLVGDVMEEASLSESVSLPVSVISVLLGLSISQKLFLQLLGTELGGP